MILLACYRKSKRSWGASLVEMLIVLSIFSAIFSLVGEMAVTAFRHEESAERGQECLRSAARVSDAIMRDLRQCEEVLWPQSTRWKKGHSVQSGALQNLAVVCRMRCGPTGKSALVGYRYIANVGHLERCVYSNETDIEASTVYTTDNLLRCDVMLSGVTCISFWTRSQAESYGKNIVGLSFAVRPRGNVASTVRPETFSGMTFCSQVQARGI